MEILKEIVHLGTLQICNSGPGEPSYLSAASGVSWVGKRLYVVGDDQGTVGVFPFGWRTLQAALFGREVPSLECGEAQRILPGSYEPDPDKRKQKKADFEALTVIRDRDIDKLPDSPLKARIKQSFPYGLLIVAGSGGVKKGGPRNRSDAVVYKLDEHGHLTGLPTKVSLVPLHAFLDEKYVIGELNIEGMCVRGLELIMSQRGNSTGPDGTPAPNMLIHLSLEAVLKSLITDLEINACEVTKVKSYDVGTLDVMIEGKLVPVKLDFTDIDTVAHDPEGRLVFSAAAEIPEGPNKGEIAGSVVGIISADGDIIATYGFSELIKIEGVNAEHNPVVFDIDLLLVSDADDPEVPAPLLAVRIPG